MSIRVRLWRGSCLLSALMLLAGTHAYAHTAPVQPMAAVYEASSSAGTPSFHGDAQRGKVLYQNCTSCHSVDENDIGPRHRGVVGRMAGTAPDYAYSPALKASGIVWDEETLDRWLTNPSALVPGTKMFFFLKDPQQRADLIAYLAELNSTKPRRYTARSTAYPQPVAGEGAGPWSSQGSPRSVSVDVGCDDCLGTRGWIEQSCRNAYSKPKLTNRQLRFQWLQATRGPAAMRALRRRKARQT